MLTERRCKMLKKIFKNTYNKWYSDGQKFGYKLGYEAGIEKVDERGDLFYELWIKDRTEIIALKEKLKEKIATNKIKEYTSTLDDHMLYFKSIIEIVNTNFFSTTLYSYADSETMKELIEYVDYLDNTFEIKTTYPETCSYIPAIKKAFTKIYYNKLITEEAERKMKK
jgi:hypothetical protein